MKILALDIGGSFIKIGTLENSLLTTFASIPTMPKNGTEALLDTITEICMAHSDIAAVGISFASQINPWLGVITSATDTFPGFSHLPLKELLESRLHLPVAVDNDVNCAAIAEGNAGSMKGQKDFVCITFGTGIGGAIMLGGKLHYGARWAAGELGHMTTHGGGSLCNCGKLGCYEQYASTKALTELVYCATGEKLSGREICSLFEDGDIVISPIVHSWIAEVCYGISSCVHMLNPSSLVLGGGIMENSSVFAAVCEKLKCELLPNFCNVSVKQAKLGNSAGIIGAGIIAMKLLDDMA